MKIETTNKTTTERKEPRVGYNYKTPNKNITINIFQRMEEVYEGMGGSWDVTVTTNGKSENWGEMGADFFYTKRQAKQYCEEKFGKMRSCK